MSLRARLLYAIEDLRVTRKHCKYKSPWKRTGNISSALPVEHVELDHAIKHSLFTHCYIPLSSFACFMSLTFHSFNNVPFSRGIADGSESCCQIPFRLAECLFQLACVFQVPFIFV